MPNRFSTEAANADVMRDDGSSEGMTHAIGADGTPRDRADRTPEPAKKAAKVDETQAKASAAKAGESEAGPPKEGEAKPGKDINAAGFVKDKEAAKP